MNYKGRATQEQWYLSRITLYMITCNGTDNCSPMQGIANYAACCKYEILGVSRILDKIFKSGSLKQARLFISEMDYVRFIHSMQRPLYKLMYNKVVSFLKGHRRLMIFCGNNEVFILYNILICFLVTVKRTFYLNVDTVDDPLINTKIS